MEGIGSLFMGDVTSEMDEQFIMDSFYKLGHQVLSVRLMKNRFNRKPLGYCFIHFVDSAAANSALTECQGKLIPDSDPPMLFNLNAARSVSGDCEFVLWVGGLSEDVDDEKLFDLFSSKYLSVKVAEVIKDEDKSRGYAFVRFTNELDYKDALASMRESSEIGNKPIKVGLATAKPVPRKDLPETAPPPPLPPPPKEKKAKKLKTKKSKTKSEGTKEPKQQLYSSNGWTYYPGYGYFFEGNTPDTQEANSNQDTNTKSTKAYQDYYNKAYQDYYNQAYQDYYNQGYQDYNSQAYQDYNSQAYQDYNSQSYQDVNSQAYEDYNKAYQDYVDQVSQEYSSENPQKRMSEITGNIQERVGQIIQNYYKRKSKSEEISQSSSNQSKQNQSQTKDSLITLKDYIKVLKQNRESKQDFGQTEELEENNQSEQSESEDDEEDGTKSKYFSGISIENETGDLRQDDKESKQDYTNQTDVIHKQDYSNPAKTIDSALKEDRESKQDYSNPTKTIDSIRKQDREFKQNYSNQTKPIDTVHKQDREFKQDYSNKIKRDREHKRSSRESKESYSKRNNRENKQDSKETTAIQSNNTSNKRKYSDVSAEVKQENAEPRVTSQESASQEHLSRYSAYEALADTVQPVRYSNYHHTQLIPYTNEMNVKDMNIELTDRSYEFWSCIESSRWFSNEAVEKMDWESLEFSAS